MMPLQSSMILCPRSSTLNKMTFSKHLHDTLRSIHIGLKSNPFPNWDSSMITTLKSTNFTSFGLVSSPTEISNTRMNMTQNKQAAERKENIWRKRIEDSKLTSLKMKRKELRNLFYQLMKMIQEFKGLRRKMKGKDRWKRNEKISLRNKRLSKKIRGSKRFRIRFRRN